MSKGSLKDIFCGISVFQNKHTLMKKKNCTVYVTEMTHVAGVTKINLKNLKT